MCRLTVMASATVATTRPRIPRRDPALVNTAQDAKPKAQDPQPPSSRTGHATAAPITATEQERIRRERAAAAARRDAQRKRAAAAASEEAAISEYEREQSRFNAIMVRDMETRKAEAAISEYEREQSRLNAIMVRDMEMRKAEAARERAERQAKTAQEEERNAKMGRINALMQQIEFQLRVDEERKRAEKLAALHNAHMEVARSIDPSVIDAIRMSDRTKLSQPEAAAAIVRLIKARYPIVEMEREQLERSQGELRKVSGASEQGAKRFREGDDGCEPDRKRFLADVCRVH